MKKRVKERVKERNALQQYKNHDKEQDKEPVMLIILDGFGHTTITPGNAIKHAKMPVWRNFLATYPNTLLNASGSAVGLLEGFIGNSEVGHKTIGAGRIIKSSLKKIHDAIADGSFFNNPILCSHFESLKISGKALHLMGLLSNAGVHSHEDHLYALIKLAKQVGLSRVFIHAFLDGRDVAPISAATYLDRLDTIMGPDNLNLGILATIHGRFYAMDRDKNWERTKISYDVLIQQVWQDNHPKEINWRTVLQNSYADNITDEFVYPTVLDPEGTIQVGDGVVFFNFRPDRARQLTECFINPRFDHFPVKNLTSFFITATRYNTEFSPYNNQVLFEEEPVDHTLLDEIESQNNRVFIIAETEKYAHVTYFFRCFMSDMINKTDPIPTNETRVLVPSLKARNYIEHPEMSAPTITEHLLASLRKNPANFYLVNYANADMVGHAGNFDATVKACECLDMQLEKIYHELVEKLDGTLFITADHGNAEEQLDSAGNPHTAHTQNPVPFVMIRKNLGLKTRNLDHYLEKNINIKFGLANIAPTILQSMGLAIPKQMTQETIFPITIKDILMNNIPVTLHERLWASAVHMPILTIIWTSYFAYHTFATHSFMQFVQQTFFSLDNIPFTPLVFTLLSIGIARTIRFVNQESTFVKEHTTAACTFNTSLLKWYGVGFIGALIGNLLHLKPMILAFFIFMMIISLNCLIQAFFGVAASLHGRVYHYWYLFK